MTPADRLLDHFDRIAGSEPSFTCVSDPDCEPRLHVATYDGFPQRNARTGFTFGLSHFHPPGGSHKELVVSMLDGDPSWTLACGYVAFQLREHGTFHCGETINFRTQIAPSSSMSAFVVVHPLHLSAADRRIDIGERTVQLMQLVPVYEQERIWLSTDGETKRFLNQYSATEIMDPDREPFAG